MGCGASKTYDFSNFLHGKIKLLIHKINLTLSLQNPLQSNTFYLQIYLGT